MKTKILGCIAIMLLALSLCGCFAPVVLAFADEGGEVISIRITPPSGQAENVADVEIVVADNADIGFQKAEVRTGEAQGWQDLTGNLDKRDGGYYGVAEIRENCTVYVRVAGNDGKTYEKSRYINCFAGARAIPAASASTDNEAVPDTRPRSATALTPDGQGAVLDNVSSENGKEFFTIKTPEENIFYLVIDREREGENVYFLNAVTESDLMALAEKDSAAGSTTAIPVNTPPVCICDEQCRLGEINTDCPVCMTNYKACAGTPREDQETQVPAQPQTTSGGSVLVVVCAAVAAGAAAWYFKIYKPKKDLADAEDLDELTGAEEETVNEDEQPQRAPDARREPEEPDYYNYEDYPNNYRQDEPQEPDGLNG